MTDKDKIIEWDKKYLWHPFTQMQDWIKDDQLVIERGEGVYLYDTDGKKYYDGVSSLWVNVHGHNNPELNDALKKQIDTIAHSTFLGLSNVPAVELAKKLVEITPDSLTRVFYSDSGSTSVEIALKIAFQYWHQIRKPGKKKFIKFINAYHGDTIGSVSIGGMELFHKMYKPLLFETIVAPYPDYYHFSGNLSEEEYYETCLNELRHEINLNAGEIAALVVEPLVQGAAGMITMPPGFMTEIRKITSENDVLLIVDEVATGFGRTGEMFACDHEKIQPDIMCLAKGISGGYLPLAATITTEKIFEGFLGKFEEKRTFFHGHTYTGNPLACAVAIKSIEMFEKNNLIKNVKSNSAYLESALEKFNELKHVGNIRRRGMMIGIELVKDIKTKEEFEHPGLTGHKVILEARRRGLIIRPLGAVIVVMPPLCINKKELEEILDITYKSIKAVTEG